MVSRHCASAVSLIEQETGVVDKIVYGSRVESRRKVIGACSLQLLKGFKCLNLFVSYYCGFIRMSAFLNISKGSLHHFGQSDCYEDQTLIDTNSSCDKSQSSSLDSLDALASVSESKINYNISCQYEQTLTYSP